MTQLWPWQQGAVEWANDPRRAPGSVWNMGMGTGKSLSFIETSRQRDARQVLIVGPKAVVSQNAWGSEFDDHGRDEWRYALCNKGNAQRKADAARFELSQARARGRRCAVVVNYETARQPAFSKMVGEHEWDLICMDESHKIKGPKSITSKWAAATAGKARQRVPTCSAIEMTGTFMPHSPLDAWAQMRAINPLLLGPSFHRFKLRYAVLGGYEGKQILRFKNLDDLEARLAPWVYRVPSDVLQLDDPILSTIEVQLPAKVARAYKDMEGDFYAAMEEGEVTATNGLTKLLRLQQFTSGYAQFDDAPERTPTQIHTAKRDALEAVLEGSMEEPVVVFGRFTGDQDSTRDCCRVLERPYFELSGASSQVDDWDRAVESAPSYAPKPVLGVQIQSGGAGINLVKSGLAVWLSTGFNLGDFDQSRARLNRPGRQPVVRFIHIVVPGTTDTDALATLSTRRDLVEGVMERIRERNARRRPAARNR